jgi:threonine-phosphate decarboxylase
VLTLHALERGDPSMPVSHLSEPTYGEYRRVSVLNALRTNVWSDHVLGWKQEFFPSSAAGIFWTGHPNNPTGRAWDRDDLLERVDGSLGLLTVVDEAFLPFFSDEADRTLVGEAAKRENLLVLRSLTKFFAIPGLRVGYAVGSADLVTRLGQYQDPWTVSAPAQMGALAALEDVEYSDQSIPLLRGEFSRVAERLWDLRGVRPAWPLRAMPSDASLAPIFILASLTDTPWNSHQVHEALARRGFLVRECSDFRGLEVGALLTGHDQLVATQGHLRIALRRPDENDRLLAALADVLNSEPPR